MSLEVNPSEIRSIGGKIISIAYDLKTDTSSVQGNLAPPTRSGTTGWSTTTAADRAAQGWQDYLKGLVGRLGQAGQSMIDAANNYQAADARSAERSRRTVTR